MVDGLFCRYCRNDLYVHQYHRLVCTAIVLSFGDRYYRDCSLWIGAGQLCFFWSKRSIWEKEQTFVHKGKLICRNCVHYSSLQSSCFAGETPKKVHGFDSCDRFRLSVNAEIEDLSGKKIKVKR